MEQDRQDRRDLCGDHRNPCTNYRSNDPIEARIHSIKAAVDRAEPLVNLIEGAFDVGDTRLKRMCVHVCIHA
ncbi:MAG: hypothetical protein JO030_04465 [Candidatus Eremiobacteraeota bacterium]|nr:hypothetical protein [Candidatus Eremiobacteraeota bacterium]